MSEWRMASMERATPDLVREFPDVFAGEILWATGLLREAAAAQGKSDVEYDDLRRHARALSEALKMMIYETTCLSPEESDGSHKCTISREALTQARAAFWDFAKLVEEWEAP